MIYLVVFITILYVIFLDKFSGTKIRQEDGIFLSNEKISQIKHLLSPCSNLAEMIIDGDEDEMEREEATIWVCGIDRIHEARGVLKCFDLTATPFKPSGRNNQDEMLFSWIVYDFGLNDAIESGLVKTPKIAVRDDSIVGSALKSKLFHIYPEVKEDLNRRATPSEGLPDLVRNAVNILGGDWLKEKEEWEKQDPPHETPPSRPASPAHRHRPARCRRAQPRPPDRPFVHS